MSRAPRRSVRSEPAADPEFRVSENYMDLDTARRRLVSSTGRVTRLVDCKIDGAFWPALSVKSENRRRSAITAIYEDRQRGVDARYVNDLSPTVAKAGSKTAEDKRAKELWLGFLAQRQLFNRLIRGDQCLASVSQLVQSCCVNPTQLALLCTTNLPLLCAVFQLFGSDIDMQLARSDPLVFLLANRFFRERDASPVFHDIAFFFCRSFDEQMLPMLERCIASGMQLDRTWRTNHELVDFSDQRVSLLDMMLRHRSLSGDTLRWLLQHGFALLSTGRAVHFTDETQRTLNRILDECAGVVLLLELELPTLAEFPRVVVRLVCSYFPGFEDVKWREQHGAMPVAIPRRRRNANATESSTTSAPDSTASAVAASEQAFSFALPLTDDAHPAPAAAAADKALQSIKSVQFTAAPSSPSFAFGATAASFDFSSDSGSGFSFDSTAEPRTDAGDSKTQIALDWGSANSSCTAVGAPAIAGESSFGSMSFSFGPVSFQPGAQVGN